MSPEAFAGVFVKRWVEGGHVREEVLREDPKDARIRQLENEVARLRQQVSDHGWEASARHAQATGGTL